MVIALVVGVGVAAGIELVGSRVRTVRMRDAPTCARAVSFGAACERCVAAFCCGELTTCFATSECVSLNDCTLGCGDTADREACRTECASKRPDAKRAFEEWDRCVRARCESECPRGAED